MQGGLRSSMRVWLFDDYSRCSAGKKKQGFFFLLLFCFKFSSSGLDCCWVVLVMVKFRLVKVVQNSLFPWLFPREKMKRVCTWLFQNGRMSV